VCRISELTRATGKFEVLKIWISADQDIRMQVIRESANQEKSDLCCEFMLCIYPDNLVT